jgi:alpha-L-rhamnosidase
MAQAIENHSAVFHYQALAEEATRAFHSVFYTAALNAYGGDSGEVQSLTVPALTIGSAPPGPIVSTLVASLAKDVQDRGLGVGSVTAKSLLNVLSDNGRHDLALRLATQTAQPSWGYWLTQNATTCWETWSGPESGGQGSRNHIFLWVQ